MTHEINLTPALSLGLDLDQYFGLWAVDDSRFLAMFDRVSKMNLAAHIEIHAKDVAAVVAGPSPKPLAVDDVGIQVIDINGTMTKRGSSLSEAASTVLMRQAIRQAAADPNVDAILLRIDSPGGTVAGTADLAAEVKRASEQKPVHAFAEDLAASAAYWVASKASKIYANSATAMIGSIGTFIGLYDYSVQAEKEGVRAIVIKAGKLKGAGFAGTEITDEQQAMWQRVVDQVQAEFVAGVATGRNVSVETVEGWADGRIHAANDAAKLGMIDGIQSFEETLAGLAQLVAGGTRNRREEKTMTQDKDTGVQAGTLRELKAACPGADNDFLCEQLDAEATVTIAQKAWTVAQNVRLESQQKQIDELKAEADKIKADTEAAAKKPGVEALGSGSETKAGSDVSDPIAAFNEAVAEQVKAGKAKAEAVRAVVKADPDLHAAYLEAVQTTRATK